MDEQTLQPNEDPYSKRIDEPEPVAEQKSDESWLDDDDVAED